MIIIILLLIIIIIIKLKRILYWIKSMINIKNINYQEYYKIRNIRIKSNFYINWLRANATQVWPQTY